MNTINGAGVIESTQPGSGEQLRSTRHGHRLFLLFLLLPLSAFALADPLRFDIPAQPLATALKTFAEQAKMQLLYKPDAISAGTSNAVVGDFDKRAALELLLKDTGLEVVFSKGNAATIRPVQSASKVTRLLSTDDSVSALGEGGGEDTKKSFWQKFRLAQVENSSSSEGEKQTSESSSENSQKRIELGEVIVTATKRTERLQDVPLSIAVVTADDIDRRGLVSAGDYLRGIPGVNQVDSGFGQSIVIRGMETDPGYQNYWSGTTVATYFGDTPTTNSAGLGAGTSVDLKLVDIERVEVLRGPQGTAFGNSSIGGAVRTIPVAPKVSSYEGKVKAAYSGTSGTGDDNYNFQAVGNLPLIADRLAIRGTAYRYYDSGYYQSRSGSDPTFQATVVVPFGAQAFAVDDEEVGSYDVLGGRIALLFRATDALDFTLSYIKQKNERSGFPAATSGPFEQTLLRVAPEHVRRGESAGIMDTDIDIANGTLQYDLGWGDLVATYSHTRSEAAESSSFSFFGLNWPVSYIGDSDHREHVGEIRLATEFDGAWNFLAGLYAENVDDELPQSYVWHGDPAANFFDPLQTGLRSVGGYDDVRSLKQRAAFGEVSWEFLPGFTLTGGARVYEYDRTFRYDATGALFGGPAGIHRDEEEEDSDTNFRANLNYKANENTLLYAAWAQGFRLGQLQPGVPAGLCDQNNDGLIDGTNTTIESTRRVHSDNVDSYELGGKFALLDRRLTIAADVFRMDWSGMPAKVLAGPGQVCGTQQYLANAGEALSEGIELQADFQVTEAFRVDLGLSSIDARLTRDVPALGAFKGGMLPGAPQTTANIGFQFDFDIGGNTAFFRANSIYLGPFFGDVAESPGLRSGDYVKVDLSARVSIQELDIDLFVDNVMDEDAFTFRGNFGSFLGSSQYFGYRLRPRTVGLRVGYTF